MSVYRTIGPLVFKYEEKIGYRNRKINIIIKKNNNDK